jgi:hypothetical protein
MKLPSETSPSIEKADKLCHNCEKIDLFALFSRAKHDDSKKYADLGTLKELRANENCPLCRLIKHQWYNTTSKHPWTPTKEAPDLSKLRIMLVSENTYDETEIVYHNYTTKDKVAMEVLAIIIWVDRECEIPVYSARDALRLLSSKSIDPKRPLNNGFKASTLRENLRLVGNWIRDCENHHQDTCKQLETGQDLHSLGLKNIRFIEVRKRQIVEHEFEKLSFAALSYVWGHNQSKNSDLFHQTCSHTAVDGQTNRKLPSEIPKVINEAIQACILLDIEYLWVDFYCLTQDDETQKSIEISAMASIYQHARITLVSGLASELEHESEEDLFLFHSDLDSNFGSQQLIESIQGREYITGLPSLSDQVRKSKWSKRSWTFQEGQFARRIAYFGNFDVVFICNSGHWRESYHSGIHAHNANIPDFDLSSSGSNFLSATKWLSLHDGILSIMKQL